MEVYRRSHRNKRVEMLRMENSMILAEKITALRKQMGWSQEELAGQLSISRQSVSKWELGV